MKLKLKSKLQLRIENNMKVKITFQEANSSYSQQYANQYQDGKESENCLLYTSPSPRDS